MKRFKIKHHWLECARKVPSENWNERPAGTAIDLIVIHCISLPPGEFGGEHIDRLFQNRLDSTQHPYFATICNLTVSTHILIRRDGAITQYVPFDRRAWHAGASSFEGRENCNDYSIGIELEGTDDTGFTDPQYASLANLIVNLIDYYPSLSRQRITGHSDIAPGRKTDPGPGFDWRRLYNLMDELAISDAQPGGSSTRDTKLRS